MPRSHSETDQQTAKINAPETPFVLLHANAAIAAAGNSARPAALSDRKEIQRAKRDGQKHRHREWWQSENRQSAETECTECEDDT